MIEYLLVVSSDGSMNQIYIKNLLLDEIRLVNPPLEPLFIPPSDRNCVDELYKLLEYKKNIRKFLDSDLYEKAYDLLNSVVNDINTIYFEDILIHYERRALEKKLRIEKIRNVCHCERFILNRPSSKERPNGILLDIFDIKVENNNLIVMHSKITRTPIIFKMSLSSITASYAKSLVKDIEFKKRIKLDCFYYNENRKIFAASYKGNLMIGYEKNKGWAISEFYLSNQTITKLLISENIDYVYCEYYGVADILKINWIYEIR